MFLLVSCEISRARDACVARGRGGAGRSRTGNLLDAIEVLSSLSYGPIRVPRPGGATGNRAPIPAMRMQRSPVELSPQDLASIPIETGRPRRNRTLSPGVGIPAGHHDSTACALERQPLELVCELARSQRLVRGSNPACTP